MNEMKMLTEAASYNEFIIRKLGISDEERQYFIPDVVPNREELIHFAMEKGMGVEDSLSKQEIVEKFLFEYGITDQEIKDNFRKYLGIEEAFFVEKYKISRNVLEQLKDKYLLPVVYSVYGKAVFIDAEYYFSPEKFNRAVKLFSSHCEEIPV